MIGPPPGGAARTGLRELFSVREPTDVFGAAVRREQIVAFLRLVPVTLAIQIVTAAVMIGSIHRHAPPLQLGLWFGAGLAACAWRMSRADRLNHDPAYAARRPATMRSICRVVVGLGVLWMVPALFWFDQFDPSEKLFVCVLSATLISVGTVTMIALPAAALRYVALMLAASLVVTVKLHSLPLMLLSVVYAALLIGAIIASARHFIAHIRTRLELEERGEIIELLREFGAAGSGGLWELDRNLRFVTISTSLAGAIGRTVEDILGRHCRELLDPTGRAVQLSSGMRTLFELFDTGQQFRDLAIPALHSGRWWSLSGKPVRLPSGEVVGWRGVASDITEMRLSGDASVRAARRDPLTGLANRLLVRELLEEALLGNWREVTSCALLLVDLDRFKLVNDTLGHAIGDQLLVEVAHRLDQTIGEDGSVGRLGGDEFAIVWRGDGSRGTLEALAERLIGEISRAYSIGAATLHVGATIGIARGPEDGPREEQLMRNADLALYRAKHAGRGGHAFYESYMFDEAEDSRMLENDVRNALHQNGLRLAYQPIVDADDGRIIGREALLRWCHPVRGEIAPDQFIPVIEDAGLIHQIGDWVIREACAEAATWDKTLLVAVNVSAAQLSGVGLAKTVIGALAASGLAPERLELEVTETVFLGDDATTLASLERLRALGVRLVLDDFGKGYSSFGYLSRAQFAKIKIDQMFVRAAAAGERESIAIVRAILALARGLGVETTAEGVETAAQAEAMRAMGCGQLQGYHFGRPVAPESFRAAAATTPRQRRA